MWHNPRHRPPRLTRRALCGLIGTPAAANEIFHDEKRTPESTRKSPIGRVVTRFGVIEDRLLLTTSDKARIRASSRALRLGRLLRLRDREVETRSREFRGPGLPDGGQIAGDTYQYYQYSDFLKDERAGEFDSGGAFTTDLTDRTEGPHGC